MDASVEAVDGYILIKFKKFLVEEVNEINVIHNFIYAFADSFGYGSMLYLILTLMLGMGH